MTALNKGIEYRIAVLYMYLLPLRLIPSLDILKRYFSACANYTDFVLHILGMLLMIVGYYRNNPGQSGNGNDSAYQIKRSYINAIIFLDVSTLFMAVVLYGFLGTIDGENTIIAVLPTIVYYIQYGFIFVYNYYIFQMFHADEIYKILKNIVLLSLLFSYIQLFSMIFGGPFTSIYNLFNFHGTFRTASYFTYVGRLPLMFSEPAAAGGFLGIFVFPVILGYYLNTKESTSKLFFEIALWLPIVYYTKSSTCYLLIVVELIAFSIISLKRRNRYSSIAVVMLFVSVGLFIVASRIDASARVEETGISDTVLQYFRKISNSNNESTVTRMIPVYIDFRIFLRFPITGVGNGNQGFFYNEFFPSWGAISKPIFDSIKGVADGGMAIPAILSGNGILGIAVVIFAIKTARTNMKMNVKAVGPLYDVFILSLFAIIANAFQGDFYGVYYVLFMLSLPMTVCCIVEHDNDEKEGSSIRRYSYIK